MLTESADGARRNRAAVFFMLAAVIGFSLTPPLIAVFEASQAPFLFNAAIYLGQAAFLFAFLAKSNGRAFASGEAWKLIGRHAASPRFCLIAAAYSNFGFFALSTRFIDVSMTTILFGTWPIFMVICIGWLFRREKRYKKITLEMLTLILVGLSGFAFVVLSQSERQRDLIFAGSFAEFDWTSLALGVAFAMVAVALTAVSSYAFRWGVDLSEGLSKIVRGSSENRDSMELTGVITGIAIASLAAVPLNVAIGLLNGESASSIGFMGLAVAFVFGMMADGGGTVGYRYANLLTNNLGVNAMTYATLPISLAWLVLLSQVAVARIDFLIIGAAGIIAANLLINFEAEIRFGFKSLIIALWACGAVVYLRPVDGALFGVENWEWTGTEYFAALALSATIFTLILSFRIARLVNRTAEEENRSFAIFQKLDSLVRRGAVSGEARQHILRIDVSEQKPESLKKAYDDTMRLISEAASKVEDESDRERLGEVEAELNALVHSKQRGIVFGELFALYVFAGITVALALFSRPEIFGWTAFLVETLAALFSAVIVFLIFNALDLQRERFGAILKKANGGGYRVAFADARSRVFERRVSVIVGLTLAATYAGLLWNKWIG